VRVPRVYVSRLAGRAEVSLPTEEGHHLVTVLRRGAGDPVVIVSEDGGLYRGHIASARPGAPVAVTVEGPVDGLLDGIPWTVAAALTKGESPELAVRMASELGLEGFLPIITERTAVRWDARSRKLERLERIARESAKQCGRDRPLCLEPPMGFDACLSRWSAGQLLAGKRSGEGPPARGWIADPAGSLRVEDLAAGRGKGTGGLPPALFLVGPEGGFSPGEIARAQAAGFGLLGFPTPVLRAPTAVALIAALGLVLGGPEETRPAERR